MRAVRAIHFSEYYCIYCIYCITVTIVRLSHDVAQNPHLICRTSHHKVAAHVLIAVNCFFDSAKIHKKGETAKEFQEEK